MKITVLGSGAWGTALAMVLVGNNHDVTLWSHREKMTEALRNKETGRAEELLARVELDYAQTYAAVKSFQDGT